MHAHGPLQSRKGRPAVNDRFGSRSLRQAGWCVVRRDVAAGVHATTGVLAARAQRAVLLRRVTASWGAPGRALPFLVPRLCIVVVDVTGQAPDAVGGRMRLRVRAGVNARAASRPLEATKSALALWRCCIATSLVRSSARALRAPRQTGQPRADCTAVAQPRERC